MFENRVDRIIFHIDVNSAFLSWEAVFRLHHKGGTVDLREIPSAVGGDVSKRHGIILAKSIPAKRYNVKTGEPLWQAKQKCPDLVIVPPNYGLYERCSASFMKILREYSDIVEQYSIDEAFIDMTESLSMFETPLKAAEEIRDRIRDELGFTVNVGVSCNKLLAKMASDFKKPDRVHTLYPDEIEEKMWPLPVSDLFFVGRATTRKLSDMGIRTIGQLANYDKEILKWKLKKQGEIVWSFANGIDFSPVISDTPANKGYGNSTTTPYDVEDVETARKVLLSLAETVGIRLRRDNVQIKVVSIGIRSFELEYASHQMVLDTPTNITKEIYEAACKLLDEIWDGTPLRHLGIQTSRVNDGYMPRQMTLFDDTDYQKLEKLDKAIDEIRNRFGIDSVMRATFVKQEENPLDHLAGGISREKRDVDYSKEKID